MLAGLLLFPVALWAHAKLLSSDPAEGATLSAGPAAIRLVFSERPELALTTVKLVSGIDTTSLGPLTPDTGPARGNGPAKYYRLAGALGTIGVITPMTHTYCASCNRVRLTADGRLRTCLFGDHEVLLRDALRRGEPLEALFRQALADKPKEHALLQMKVGGLRALSQVGG